MSYKLLVLAPSAGGKSTLMRYLREHTDLLVAETDEEVMKANNDIWPDNELKNTILIPQTTKEIIARKAVVYLASYLPDELIKLARSNGFKVILLELTIDQLQRRNKQRMQVEDYQDAAPWIRMQLDNFTNLKEAGLIDKVIDGNQAVEALAQKIVLLAKRN